MNEFIDALRDSGIIQKLRAGLNEADKIKFDEAVENTIKEYNSMWLEAQPMINDYHEKVKKHADQSEGEPGRDVESDNE